MLEVGRGGDAGLVEQADGLGARAGRVRHGGDERLAGQKLVGQSQENSLNMIGMAVVLSAGLEQRHAAVVRPPLGRAGRHHLHTPQTQ